MTDLRRHWSLDPDVTFLNHGSFGAAPTAVLEHQSELRAQLERQPVRFFLHDEPELRATANQRAAEFLGADPAGFAFVTNATTGVNTVLRSLRFQPGDELLVTNHEYRACRLSLDRVAAESGATVKVVDLPFPGTTEDAVVAAIEAGLSENTRLLLIDHVSSPTAIVMPIARLTEACHAVGAEILVDGAHAIGMVHLDLDALGVDYFTGNFHKWGCTPKGVAALWVAPRHLHKMEPLVTSHGAQTPTDDPAARFRAQFDWVGTTDPTAALSVPFALDYMASLVPGGWDEIRRRNQDKAARGRDLLLSRLGGEAPAPASMLGSMATVPLPPGDHVPTSIFDIDPVQRRLFDEFGIEVPILLWPNAPTRWCRISMQLYNDLEDVQALADALAKIL